MGKQEIRLIEAISKNMVNHKGRKRMHQVHNESRRSGLLGSHSVTLRALRGSCISIFEMASNRFSGINE